jgi:uncharacterized protein
VTTSPAVEVSRHHRAAALPTQEWSALLDPFDFFLSPPWLRVVEATAGVPIWYLLARQGQDAVAGLPTALADSNATWALGRPDTVLSRCERDRRAGASALRQTLPAADPAALLPSLVCGGRHLGRNRIVYRRGTDEKVLASLVAAAEDLASSRGAASTVFLYVDEQDRSLRHILDERGYRSFASGEVSSLPLPPGGFTAYVNGLSAHRRRRVLAERRTVAAADVKMSIEPLTTALVPTLAKLETSLYHKYGVEHWQPELSVHALNRILDILGDAALLCLARADDDVRGFGLILRFRDTWYMHRCGFDYARKGALPLYFETLYYHPIEIAPDHGVTALHYGTGSVDTKRSRGCMASEQRAYLRMLEPR